MTVQGGVKAGKISKPYGLQGDVHIILIPAVAQILKIGSPLFIDIDGQRVPFFMESVDLPGKDSAIVKLEFINSVEEARKVAGCDVYLQKEDAGTMIVNKEDPVQMVGYLVKDLKAGELGTISDYIPGEMNPMWVIEQEGREILIPSVEDFIHKTDHKNKILHLDLPEGITEL